MDRAGRSWLGPCARMKQPRRSKATGYLNLRNSERDRKEETLLTSLFTLKIRQGAVTIWSRTVEKLGPVPVWLDPNLGQMAIPRVVRRRSYCQTFIVPLACQILKRLFSGLFQGLLLWIPLLSLRQSRFATILLYLSQHYQERLVMLGLRSTIWSETQKLNLLPAMAPPMRTIWWNKTDRLIGRWRYGRSATTWSTSPKRKNSQTHWAVRYLSPRERGKIRKENAFCFLPWGKVRASQYNTLAIDRYKLKYLIRCNERNFRRCRFHWISEGCESDHIYHGYDLRHLRWQDLRGTRNATMGIVRKCYSSYK